MSKFVILLFSLLALQACEAYKVLIVFPIPGKSHSILGYGIVKRLLKVGHEVTYITPFPEKNSDPKLHQVDVSNNIALMASGGGGLSISSFLEKKNGFELGHALITGMMNSMHVATLQNENVQKLINDPKQTFDVVIAEWLFSEYSASYAAIFDAHLIWLSSLDPHWAIMRLIDENLHPAYNADTISNNMPPFNFLQRIEELWTQIKVTNIINNVGEAEYKNVAVPIIKKRGREPPSFNDLKFNASLILGNSHVSLGAASRLPQNYKAIAGYHIDDDVKPLTEDLKKLFDNEKNGVIYFSMGSNLKSKDLPEEVKKGLLKMFSGLKQTVLWKFEEDFPDLPKNVKIVKWAPQPSILSHPNCILFITHGGLLSTTESIHFGVPIIGIPVFADQFMNVKRATVKGYGKEVNLSYNLPEDLKIAIDEMLNNPSYRERVKELSFIYHDRVASPGAELVHWVQHVVRTGGAPHLRSPALHVPLYQKLYLDLLAVIFASLFIVYSLLKRIFSRKKKDLKKKNK